MHLQVLIHPQSVERLGVKSGQEHTHHDKQVEVVVLHPQRDVLIVVLEFFAADVVFRFEHIVIVGNCHLLQKLLTCIVKTVDCGWIFICHTCRFIRCLIRLVGEYGGYLQLPSSRLSHLLFQRKIIFPRHRHAVHGKDGVESACGSFLLLLHGILTILYHLCHIQEFRHIICLFMLRLLVEVVENIVGDKVYSLWRSDSLLLVDTFHLLVFHAFLLLHRLDVVNMEFQHVLVSDGIHDGVCVQRTGMLTSRVKFAAKHLSRCLTIALAVFVGVLGEDWRSCESEHHIFLKRLAHQFMHVAKL